MTPELLGQAREFLTQSLPKASVGVVGDLAMDRFVFGSVDRISPEAPVPVLSIERTLDKPGMAANVAMNLAGLGKPFDPELHVLGVVGDDQEGRQLGALLKNLGTNSKAHVFRDKERPTTLKTRFLAGNQHQLLRVDSESTKVLSKEIEKELRAEIEKVLPTLKTLVVQDYAKGCLSKEFLGWLLKEARDRSVLSIVDPNPRTPGDHYRRAGLLTPNVFEAEVLLGRSLHKGESNTEIEEACREIRYKYDLDQVLLTRSAFGMTLLASDGKAHHFPSIARAVFDVTGAGDTVVGVLAAAVASGATLPVACVVATLAASVVVAKVGTATASVEEILAALQDLPH